MEEVTRSRIPGIVAQLPLIVVVLPGIEVEEWVP